MTERFCMNKGLYSFEDTENGKTYSEYNLDEIVRLLNDFHEENLELRKIIEDVVEVSQSEIDEELRRRKNDRE